MRLLVCIVCIWCRWIFCGVVCWVGLNVSSLILHLVLLLYRYIEWMWYIFSISRTIAMDGQFLKRNGPSITKILGFGFGIYIPLRYMDIYCVPKTPKDITLLTLYEEFQKHVLTPYFKPSTWWDIRGKRTTNSLARSRSIKNSL